MKEAAPPPPRPPPAAGFTSAPLCHLPPKPFEAAPTAASTRLLQTEPLKLPRKPWGFTSAPLMVRLPQSSPAPPPPAPTESPEEEQAPPAPAAITRLPGKAGFTSSPLCTEPPKPRVAVGVDPTEDASPPPPPPPSTVEERVSALPPVQAFRSNLQLWKRRASDAVQPLPKQLRGARSRMFSPPSSPKSAAGDFSGPSEDRAAVVVLS